MDIARPDLKALYLSAAFGLTGSSDSQSLTISVPRLLERLMILLRDIRFALRTLAKSPGFTIVAVTALALGIGANATVFTLTNAILFKGFPFDKSDRILYLNTKDSSRPANQFSGVSYPDFRDWRDQAKSFDGLAADTGERISISDAGGLPESYLASKITVNAFRVIGQKPAIGRDFDPGEDAPGAAPVAILNDGLWHRATQATEASSGGSSASVEHRRR